MLRRKLLIRIGLLVVGFVAGAVVAIWLLQDVLRRVDDANNEAVRLVDSTQDISAALTTIETARMAGAVQTIDPAVARLNAALGRLAFHPLVTPPSGPAAGAYAALAQRAPGFIAQARAPIGAAAESHDFLASALALQQTANDLARPLRAYVAAEQVALARYFRGLVLALTLAALLMVNVAIFVLLRTAQMVLRPVAALVEGSRELAAERFAHRVNVGEGDEFAELAHAYNRLADQLMANEERKAETLRQLAVALNHDLNNAMTVIEMQLGLVDRQAGTNPVLSNHLRQIRATLAHMAGTVSSLKHIRRIVLTDYGPGQKMVDLERSVADVEPPAAGSAA